MVELLHILAAVDLSDPSRAAIEYAVYLGERCGATVDALHVWQTPADVGSPSELARDAEAFGPELVGRYAREQAEARLFEFLQPFVQRGMRLHPHLEFGKPVPEILRFAEKGRHDLIVMGTQGRTGVARALLGSVAASVVRDAKVPVLVVRAAGVSHAA